MKKLDNKGFAISTMLYGILTMIILILTLLLSIMRSSFNKENAATEDVVYYLNKCISKQVTLENCYRTYNANPTSLKSCAEEYEAYTTCLGEGVEAKTNVKVANLKNLLIDRADLEQNGLIVDTLESKGTNIRYIFIGANPQNYIKLGPRMGRIIAIEPNNTIKVMFTEKITAPLDKTTAAPSQGDQSGSQKWQSSTLFNQIKTKYNSMEYTSKLEKGNFYTGVYYNGDSTKLTLEKIRSEYVEAYYGIPSFEDYLKASGNIASITPKCNLEDNASSSLNSAIANCKNNNWLANGQSDWFWTTTGVNGIASFMTYNNSANATGTTVTTSRSAYMVVYLKSSTLANITANGTSSNPYIVDLR